jgi:molybdate transport system permease protein
LVLIAPTNLEITADSKTIPELLHSTEGSIAVGDPSHVPCGMYTKEALTNLNCWQAIQNRIIPAASVRMAQQYVESGQCELGIVYKAGAEQSKSVTIVSVFDSSLHMPIRFTAAAAANNVKGNDFIRFLHQGVAVNIFTQAGFTMCNSGNPSKQLAIATDPPLKVNTWQTLTVSFKVAATCTLIAAAPGIWLGYILARKSFPGRSIINALIHLPMVIPPVVTGYLALVLLGKNSLAGKWLYDTFGISVAFSWAGAVVVSAVMGMPLLVRSVRTAVEMIDRRYALAADTLGAGPIRTFITVTIPLAAPGILAGLVLAFARCLGEFGATATFAGNIPGKTQTLSLAIYSFTQIPGAESAAMRLVVLSILLSLAAMLGSEWLSQRMKHLAETT